MAVEMSSNPMMLSSSDVEVEEDAPREDSGSGALTVDEMLSLHVGGERLK
jgi:hypothetical protein